MCGIIFTNKIIYNLLHIAEFLAKRGPDKITQISYKGYNFIHALLSMTGNISYQPFIDYDNEIVAMFNGEIYNYKKLFIEAKSDGECIIPTFLNHGKDFIKQFDGEFAIILCDFKNKKIYASTDIFSTKPLWIALDGNYIAVSSYQSCLHRLEFTNIIQIESNATIVINMNTMLVEEINKIYNFDLKQYKNTYTDLFDAMIKSIKKRTRDAKHNIFIGLSSGYDSGTIALILNILNIDYTAYTIIGSEDEEIINKRYLLTKNMIKIFLSKEDFMEARKYLKNNCEEYKLNIDNGEVELLEKYIIEYDKIKKQYETTPKKNIENLLISQKKKIDNMINIVKFRKNGQTLTNDNGAIGMSYICSIARPKGQIIYLSGSGADEIFSDYGYKGIKHFRHSTIGGHFPENLEEIFPWKNFFSNTQRAYLMKEEYVTGSYGIEGRYPFLDKNVVQEFLWLSNELKNKYYKAPLHQFMTLYNYPFKINNKAGFNCGFTGQCSDESKNYQIKKTNTYEVGITNDASLIADFKCLGKSTEELICIDKELIKHVDAYCFSYPISTSHLGDISGLKSNYILYENNVPLVDKNVDIEMIISYGMGRYSHWTSNILYFSTSDNSDPRYNNFIYKFVNY